MHVNGGGESTASSTTKKQTNLAEKTCTQRSFQTVVGTGAGGESPQMAYAHRARLRSRTTASSGMRHIASSCTSYTHVYLATRGCRLASFPGSSEKSEKGPSSASVHFLLTRLPRGT